MRYVYLLVAVISEGITWTLKLVVKILEEITVMFRAVPSVTLYVVFMNDTYRAIWEYLNSIINQPSITYGI